MSQISFKAPWGRIRGLSFGNQNAKTKVVCLHGWQDNCGLFRPLIEKMDLEKRHYIALDFMGHGLSDPMPLGLPYNFINYCYGLQYVINEAKFDKFILMGHSMGGNVAGMYASLFPENIEKLILFDSAGMPLIREDWGGHVRKSIEKTTVNDSREQRPNPAYTKEQLIERLQRGLMLINSRLNDQGIEAWFERGATKQDDKFVINRDYRLALPSPPVMGHDQLTSMFQKIVDADFDVLFLRPKDPESLITVAELGKFLSIAENFASEALKKPGNSQAFVEGNHHFFVNEPAKTAAVIENFL